MEKAPPLSLSLTSLPSLDKATCAALLRHLKTDHGLQHDPAQCFSWLIQNEQTHDWLQVTPLGFMPTVEQLVEEIRWFRFDGRVKIGRHRADIEMYVFPTDGTPEGKAVSIEFKLGTVPSEAMWNFNWEEGRLDRAAKQSVVDFCLDVASTLSCPGFLLNWDNGELPPLTVDGVSQRLQRETRNGKRELPGLLTGLQRRILSRKQLVPIWGDEEQLYEHPLGYTVLDVISPLVR